MFQKVKSSDKYNKNKKKFNYKQNVIIEEEHSPIRKFEIDK